MLANNVRNDTSSLVDYMTSTKYNLLTKYQPKGNRPPRLAQLGEEMKESIAAVRARTLLCLATSQNKLKSKPGKIWCYDPEKKVYYETEVWIFFWEEDEKMVDWTVETANYLLDDSNPEANDEWDSCEGYDNLFPEIREEDIKSEKVKAAVACSLDEGVGWSHIRGWVYLFQPKLDTDLLMISSFIALSEKWLSSPSKRRFDRIDMVDGDDQPPAPNLVQTPADKQEFIINQRRQNHNYIRTVLSVLD